MNREFCERCKRKKTEFLLCEKCLDVERNLMSPREPKSVSLQEVEDLKKELETTSELWRVTNEANDRNLALLASAQYELKKIHDALPDYCYRCERRCQYAGTEESTGAQRCAECLLIDSQAEITKLRVVVEELGNPCNWDAVIRQAKERNEATSKAENLEEELEAIWIAAGKSIPRDKLVSVVGQWKEERDHGKWTIQDLRDEIERLQRGKSTLTPCSIHKGFKEDCGCL